MFIRSLLVIAWLAALVSSKIFARPATEDYVIEHIKATSEALQNQINKLKPIIYKIGDEYQGGIIFWVDHSGQHGLIMTKMDVGGKLQWQNGPDTRDFLNASGNGIGAGDSNSHIIITKQTFYNSNENFAALAAVNLSITTDGETICHLDHQPTSDCFAGWYLPSLYELNLIQTNLQSQGLGNFSSDYYWSSTEINDEKVWAVNWGTGKQESRDKGDEASIRPIRAF